MGHEVNILNNAPHQMRCPDCSHEWPCLDPDHSTFFGCPECSSFFNRENGLTHVQITFRKTDRRNPDIPLGATGELNGRQYTVVGMMRKRADNEAAWWNEYVLTSPGIANYHILAEYNGHWTLIWKLADPENFDIEGYGEAAYNVVHKVTNRKYHKYAKYHFNITYAVGEFDWDILAECNTLEVTEYIDPPEIVVSEYKDNDSQWYEGTWVSPRTVAKAFGLPQSALPPKAGMGALEVPTFYSQRKPLLHFTILVLIVVAIAELFIGELYPAKEVFNGEFTIKRDTVTHVAQADRSETFELKKKGSLDFSLQSNVHNNWVELDISLVNENSGQTYEFTKAVEYYAGVEDGESWSEGEQTQTALLTHIPAGRYHLNVQPFADTTANPYYSIKITQDGYQTSNLILYLLAIFAFPAIQYFRRSYYESQRWQ